MIGDLFYIVDLDKKLRRNREESAAYNDPTGKIKARIAAVEAQKEQEKKMIVARTAKIRSYLEYGYSRQEISQMLGLHPYIVDTEAAHVEREERQMDPIRPGWKRASGSYVCITPGLPTRR
jgi:hypothetical protein